MMWFFSIQWFLAGLMNLINAYYPNGRSSFGRNLDDFLLGAMFGVTLVIFVHYGIGFFTPS